jgi:hypothetical protein
MKIKDIINLTPGQFFLLKGELSSGPRTPFMKLEKRKALNLQNYSVWNINRAAPEEEIDVKVVWGKIEYDSE